MIPALAATATLLVTAGSAAAQGYGPSAAPPPPPPPAYQQPVYPGPEPMPVGVQRDGFTVGFSLGVGALTSDACNSCDSLEGGAGELHLGFMVNPQVALLVEGYAFSHQESNDVSLNQVIGAVAAQYWIRPNIWLKGGLGTGQVTLTDSRGDVFAESEEGAAVMVAGGFEVYQGHSFAIDLALRAAVVSYEHADTVTQTAATVGFNWY